MLSLKQVLFTMILCCLCSKLAFATPPVVDVYKSQQINATQLTQKFKTQFQQIKNILVSPEGLNSTNNQQQFYSVINQIKTGIHQLGKFNFIEISPIKYPDLNNIYITIDVVDAKDVQRIASLRTAPTETHPDPDHLLAQWQVYEKTGMDIFFKNKKLPFKNCPVFHCVFGFEHSALHKYEKVFSDKVNQNKSQLITILMQDKDAQKRATAAFLLGHLKNGEELITLLLPAIHDPSSAVRNNAMRVLGMTISKMTNVTFPIEKIVPALDFPLTVDRNKSLYVVQGLVTQPRYARYIQQHASEFILENLKMQQPDLHDIAYAILLKMSGKHFSDRDYQSWQHWLKTATF